MSQIFEDSTVQQLEKDYVPFGKFPAVGGLGCLEVKSVLDLVTEQDYSASWATLVALVF